MNDRKAMKVVVTGTGHVITHMVASFVRNGPSSGQKVILTIIGRRPGAAAHLISELQGSLASRPPTSGIIQLEGTHIGDFDACKKAFGEAHFIAFGHGERLTPTIADHLETTHNAKGRLAHAIVNAQGTYAYGQVIADNTDTNTPVVVATNLSDFLAYNLGRSGGPLGAFPFVHSIGVDIDTLRLRALLGASLNKPNEPATEDDQERLLDRRVAINKTWILGAHLPESMYLVPVAEQVSQKLGLVAENVQLLVERVREYGDDLVRDRIANGNGVSMTPFVEAGERIAALAGAWLGFGKPLLSYPLGIRLPPDAATFYGVGSLRGAFLGVPLNITQGRIEIELLDEAATPETRAVLLATGQNTQTIGRHLWTLGMEHDWRTVARELEARGSATDEAGGGPHPVSVVRRPGGGGGGLQAVAA